jgi:outer membrane immunogenic protein
MSRRSAGLLALLVTAAVAAATTALAADLPVAPPGPSYTPAYQPAVYNWTGFYFGGNVGGNMLYDTFTVQGTTSAGYLNAGTSTKLNYFGVIGGLQGGADYEFGPMVVGVAGSWLGTDISASAITASLNTATPESQRANTNARWFATATGRLGYAANDLLFYAKGGAAWAGIDYREDVLSGPFGVVGSTQSLAAYRFGFTVGAGLEYELTEHFTAFLEYDFLDFGTANYNFNLLSYELASGLTGTGLPVSVTESFHEFMFGINFRYN